jgi:phenylacetate-CoA ligase
VYAAYGCSGFDRQVNIASAGKKDRAGPVGLLRRWGLLPRVIHIAATAPPAQNAAVFHAERPTILAGHAIGIEALADHLLASGASVHPPRVVICAAMDVTEHCLQLAERALHAPAVNVYVTNELGVVGWACPQRRDALHINEDAFVLEILDPQGQPVGPGVTGEIVITSLVHKSMPLIRYRIGDRGSRFAEPCICGRPFGLMSPVQGRTAHTIEHPSGWMVTGPSIASAFSRAEAYAWVRRLQVHEEEGATLRVLLEVRRAPSEFERERLREYLREVTRGHYGIELDIVPEIAPAPNGKHQYVVPMQAAPARRVSAA